MILTNKYLSAFFAFAFSLHFATPATATTCSGSVNVALASNGANATASSAYDPVVCGSGAVGANDGDRTGRARCNNRVWNDAAPANTFPDWLQIDFNGSKTITEIDVITLQDHLEWPVEPTEAMTFSQHGLTAYQVQYWNNSTWVTIPGGSVTGNNKIWRKFTFAAITTTKIRVLATASPDGYSRIVELEAWTGPSPEPRYDLALGATATASTSFSGWGPSAVVNGDRKSLNAYSNGAWSSSAANNFPEWVQVDLGANKTINEIHVFTLQDNWANSVEPTPATTFTLYGLIGYDLQYWTGSGWVTVPGGNVTGNNKIWRTFTFSPITTSKLRVLTNAAPDGVSRVTEIEAYGPQAGECQSISRLDPLNATGGGGENPLSQNFNWNLPVVSLPGRAGLDLDLTLSYNSLVWTKNNTSISFDQDRGFPGPGFRLGFPVIQQLYYNNETGKYAHLLIGPDGSRTELRQVGTSVFFEAADSSHLLLDTSDMTLRGADGAALSYQLMGNQFNCTKVKDRNGNYITVDYVSGRLDKVIDTLGRQIKFNYDGAGLLISITQTWNQGQPSQTTHPWAEFAYTDTTIQTNFSNLTVDGPANNTTIKTLSKVTLADDSHFDFSYTSWGQVWKVAYIAADNVNHVLNYRAYNLPGSPLQATSAQSDCPRFTQRREWVKYWNGDTDGTIASNEEAVTAFSGPVNDTWTMPGDSQPVSGKRAQITLPDGTVDKIYFVDIAGEPRWRRGLPALVETSSGGDWQRKVKTTWTQDNTSVDYPLNPRVVETNIHDRSGNRARTEITYEQFTFANNLSCWLPRDFKEYAADAATVLRTTRTSYNMSASYTDRRILGLPSERLLYDGTVSGPLMARAEFYYDETGSIQGTETPTQHNNPTYVIGRGNLTRVKRPHLTDHTQSTSTTMKYNRAGAVVSSKDASDHEVLISYADSFSDGNNSRGTLAYPTTFTDADGYSSITKYSFDFGGITYTRSPQPNGTSNAGPEQSFTFDSIGRLQQFTNLVNNAYTRFVYVPSQLKVERYTTIEAGQGESLSFRIVDGVGRMIASAADHPGSTGGYSGQKFVYDAMGRAIKTSNPTETSASGTPFQWNTAGDDASTGWIYTEQTYDWKGRPRVTTNQDGTTKTITYSNCGCAGGQVMTLTDEGTIDGGVTKRRQQRVYSDVLGRTIKQEFLTWENGSVYATTVNAYNVRNQVTLNRRYAGPESSGTFQETLTTYDGYGRLASQHVPEQNPGLATTWAYNADDTVLSVTDARGASTTYAYNARHRTTGITYSASGGISVPAPVTYGYDAAGNRSWMDESGQRRVTYHYDALSRMDSEDRQFPGLTGTYRLSYGYNLAGQLKSITDPTNSAINYTYDRAGRVTAVNGTPYGTGGINGTPYIEISQYASNLKYRAWGALKSLTYGNQMTLAQQFNNRLQLTQFVVGNQAIPLPGWETRLMSSDFQYYADGNLRSASDNLGDVFDRAYAYNHVGGAKEAYSGSEALDFLNGTSSGTATGPYRQSFQHDAFGNSTSNTSRFWSQFPSTTNSTYINNRKTGGTYDAEGNLTQDADLNYEYDAAGRSAAIWSAASGKYISPTYDGDGQVVHRTEFEWGTSIPNFFQLRSTVLGGKVITELDVQGQKKHTYVYCNGKLIARQDHLWIVWQHENPFTGTRGGSNRDGQAAVDVQADPSGVDVGLYDPYPDPENWEPPQDGLIGLLPGSGIPSGRCMLDGIPIFCSDAANLLHAGAAEFEQPETVWQDGRWVFVNFNRDTREYQKPVFSHFDYTSVTDDDGRTSGKWHAVFEGTVLSTTDNLFRLFAFDRIPAPRLKRTPLPRYTAEENEMARKAIDRAIEILGSNLKCNEFFKDALASDDDPHDTLKSIHKNNGFKRGARGYRDAVARTALPLGKRSVIHLYDVFFEPTVGGTTSQFAPDTITADESRALTILHEFAHAIYKTFHAGPLGGMTSQELDEEIFRRCFNGGKTPLPKGVAE